MTSVSSVPTPGGRPASFLRAFRRVRAPLLLGVFPLGLLLIVIVSEARGQDFAVDFHNEVYRQARDVLHGITPYPPPDADLSSGRNRIWPMAAVLPATPLALLPWQAAAALMTALILAALGGTLYLLKVRDWRVYGSTLLWPPVINAVQTGNVTLPLCFLVALAWRERDRIGVAGGAIGLALALKFFLWPLVVWLAIVRRWREACIAVAVAAASLALLLPFIDLVDYLRLVRNLARTFQGESYTVYGFLVGAGVTQTIAHVVTIAIGGVLIVLAWRRRSLSLSIGAALALSPIVWLHFFALLIVPMAIVRPRFSALWLVPLLMWFAPGTLNGELWQTAQVLVAASIAIAWCALLEGNGQGPAGALVRPVIRPARL